MGSIGWHNPYPFEVGGGATNVETLYRAMRASVGVGGSALNDDSTIDGLWRQARASGLAAAATTGERALMQAFPRRSSDLLEYYEELLGATPELEDSVVERQLVVERLYTERVRAAVPDLTLDLIAIDPRFSIVQLPHDEATETVFGRAFEDLAGAEPFNGGRKSTLFANYSTEFVLTVLFDIGAGVVPSPDEQRLLEQVKDHLNKTLPSWLMFQVLTKIGFILDEDLLDLTALNP